MTTIGGGRASYGGSSGVQSRMPVSLQGPPSYSSQVATNGQGYVVSEDRPYKDVGKFKLDMLATSDPMGEPNETGGFLAGLFGALGQTFGEGGRQFGTDLGRLIEKPLGLGGDILGLIGSVPLPFGTEIAQATGLALKPGEDPMKAGLFSDVRELWSDPQGQNIGDVFMTALSGLGLLGRGVERMYAGSEQRGALPADLQAEIDSGHLTRDEALDQLVVRGQGFTDDIYANMAWSIVLDPLSWASLGVGAVSKAGKAATKIEQAARLGSDVANGVKMSPEIARLMYKGGQVTSEHFALADIQKLSRLERASLNTVGRLPGFQSVLTPVANQVIRLTDPLKIFSGGDIGKRTAEVVATSSTVGVMSAYKLPVVERVAKAVQAVAGDGRARINRALAIYTSNLLNEHVIDDLGTEALNAGQVPTKYAGELRARGALDASVGRDMTVRAERLKPIAAGLSEADMARETAEGLAWVADSSPDAIKGLKGGYDEYALMHAVRYAEAGRRLTDEVKPALNAVPEDLGPVEQFTMVARQTLTKQRWDEVQKMIDAGDTVGVRAAIQRYKELNWVGLTGENKDLLDDLTRWGQANREGLTAELAIREGGVLRPDLPAPLRKWLEDVERFGYTLAQAPPPDSLEAMFRITRDAEGQIIHMDPWLDFTTEHTLVKSPGRFARLRNQAFRQIRTEQVLWSNKRRFIQNVAKTGKLSEQAAGRIYHQIMYAASDRGLMPRGLRPIEIMDAAKKALKIEKDRGAIGLGSLSEVDLTKQLLMAFEGDLSLVGATQKLTGRAKSVLPGAGENQWGQIAEKLYPMARFTLNHFFMLQEFVEPFVLNLMRGAPIPLKRNAERYAESLRFRNAMDTLIRKSDAAPDSVIMEAAEMQQIMLAGVEQANKHLGPTSVFGKTIGRFRPRGVWGNVAETKRAAEGALAQKIIGRRLKDAFDQIKGPEYWAELERAMPWAGGDPGKIAFRWLSQTFDLASKDGEYFASVTDLLKADNMGAATRIRTGRGPGARWHHVATALGRTTETGDEELLRSLKLGVTEPTHVDALSRSDFIQQTTEAGFDPVFADRAYKMATGPEVDDFWKAYRNTMFGTAKAAEKDAGTRALRSLVQARARVQGLTEEEWIKTHFAGVPELATEANLRGTNSLFEVRATMANDIEAAWRKAPEEVRALIDMEAVPKVKAAAAARVGGMLRSSERATEFRAVMAELPDDVVNEQLFNYMVAVQPETIRPMLDTLTPAERRFVEPRLEKAEALRARKRHTVTIDGKKHVVGNVTPEDLRDMALEWMPEHEGLAAKAWYPETYALFKRTFGDESDRMIRMFGLSQANDSPVNGLAMVLRAMEQALAEGFDEGVQGTKIVSKFATTKPRVVGGVRKTLQLNAENLTKGLINAPITSDFGPKLNDFLDSLLGNSSRRWVGRTEGLMPAAIDRHTARDIGLMDAKHIQRLTELPTSRTLANGVIEINDDAGDLIMRVIRVGKGKDFHLVDEAGQYVDEAGQAVDKPVSATNFTSAPDDIQYELGVQRMNEAAKVFNTHVDPTTGVQGVWGKTDWTAADVQAVGWMRIQKALGGAEESPLVMGQRNTQSILAEVSAERGSDWEPFTRLTAMLEDHQVFDVTSEVNTAFMQAIRDEFGIATVVTDWAAPSRWRGGAQSVSAPSLLLATAETGDDVADLTALAYRQRAVLHPKPISKSRFNPKGANHHPVLDIVHSGDEVTARRDLTRLVDELDPGGASILKDGNGRFILRIIDMDEADPFLKRLADGTPDPAYMDEVIDAAKARAGLTDEVEHEAWLADVYEAGPYRKMKDAGIDRLNDLLGREGAIQKAYDAGDTALGQRLQAEAEALRQVEKDIWSQHSADTLALLRGRGRQVDEGTISRVRDAATSAYSGSLRRHLPDQWNQLTRGDTFLADARAGRILGGTERLSDGRVILRATRSADPGTALHELSHVFATDLDGSAKQLIQRARATYLNENRTDLTARIAAAEAKATAAKSATTRRKYNSIAVALKHDLGELVDEAEWGVQHEEWFADEFNRWIKTGRPPTRELQGVFEHFRNWLTTMWESIRGNKAVRQEAHPEMVKFFEGMFSDRVPSTAYSIDEHAMMLAAKQVVQQGMDEARTTQYFKQGRSFVERSINHPFIGMYPASYYWGKIVPEMFRFLALRPFGMETPLLTWNALREVSDTVRMQETLDPSVRDWMERNEDFFMTVSMLFPAVPMDIPVNTPLWARRIAEQGLENADAVAQGRTAKPIDYMKGVSDSAGYIFGPAQTLERVGDVLGGIGDTVRQATGIPLEGAKPGTGGNPIIAPTTPTGEPVINPLTGLPLQ